MIEGQATGNVHGQDRTLIPVMRMRPDDPNLPNLLRQAEMILAWRAAARPLPEVAPKLNLVK
jgi:hypothetical protein